jgi:hypothetical protein
MLKMTGFLLTPSNSKSLNIWMGRCYWMPCLINTWKWLSNIVTNLSHHFINVKITLDFIFKIRDELHNNQLFSFSKVTSYWNPLKQTLFHTYINGDRKLFHLNTNVDRKFILFSTNQRLLTISFIQSIFAELFSLLNYELKTIKWAS